MTSFVSLLFNAMIPIDCEITNLSLHLHKKNPVKTVFKLLLEGY